MAPEVSCSRNWQVFLCELNSHSCKQFQNAVATLLTAPTKFKMQSTTLVKIYPSFNRSDLYIRTLEENKIL